MKGPEREGVIKYELVFERKPLPDIPNLASLIAWRAVLHRLRLIGQDPARYAGLGFGNVSQRVESPTSNHSDQFVISGSQTGLPERLSKDRLCLVTDSSIRDNRIVAEGLVKPSSEALTHAAVYGCNPAIRFVMHVHSPEIWRSTRRLSLANIGSAIAYGTTEMADAVRDMVLSQESEPSGIFSMLGHEDGIISYADSAKTAANLLTDALARALAFD
jgi:L-ribulose-5-phosphate 4-epimerase